MRRRILAALVTVIVAGCSAGGHSGGPSVSRDAPSTASPGALPTSPTAPANTELYVSLGDSYAAGYQPGPSGPGTTTRNGFAYLVPGSATAKGYSLSLVNFGCGGATTESILHTAGCEQIGPEGQVYVTEPQATAAERFLADHRGKVRLVTVVIGGNDITKCALVADPTACVTDAVQTIKTDLATLLRGVRAAAGPGVQIVGLTYPDVVLGGWTLGPAGQNLARLSVAAFKTLINPAFADAYAAIGATFVDVTAASGAYGSLDETTTLAPYGTVPVPVAKVCQLTFFCDRRDIHPTNAGYKLISDLVIGALQPGAPSAP